MYTIYGITSTFGKSYVSAQTLKYDLPNVYDIWYIHLVNHNYVHHVGKNNYVCTKQWHNGTMVPI